MIKDSTLCAVVHPKFVETKIRSFDSNPLTDILANMHTTGRKELVIMELALWGEGDQRVLYRPADSFYIWYPIVGYKAGK